MGFITLADKTISAKLVYYGVGVGGKTTSLQAVHKTICPRNEVQLVSIKTEEDSTLLFDFLPINLGLVEGFKIRIQGFTVPGQPKYRLMRKYVLSGADAVVFVVDSQRSRLEENLQSLESLKENLRLNKLDAERIPLVLQYNKRDVADVLPEEELDKLFKFRGDLQAFPSIATEGSGVFETFVHAAGLLVEAKVQLYGLGKGEIAARAVADAARKKLWEIYDQARGEAGTRTPALAVTLPEDGPIPPAAPPAKPASGVVPAVAAPALAAPASDDELKFDDESGPVLTDDELNVDLDLERIQAADSGPRPDVDDHLLDRAVQSNLTLAQNYGELDRQRVLLEEKNRELVKVAQNTVHDLNRPLSVLKLLLSSIHKGYLGEVPDAIRSGVENGLLAVRQMERLIADLLDSSRLDYDGVKLTFEESDMTLLVAEVVRALRAEIEEHDVVVVVEAMPSVKCDAWAMTKVFANLLGNAIQYAHPDRRARVKIYCEAEQDRSVFVVEDNGIGIPQKDIGRLFRRFERGSNTQGITGTGLGLHIVKEVAMGHGGTAWVESNEGQGSRFMVAIPHQPAQPEHSTVSDVAEAVDR
jgi:signal transduction histidine kinase/signal recognition particle receptor subunit beta